jgi:hypothetical protein
MSLANASVRWVHRKPTIVTGFIPSAIEWLGTVFQIINDGRLLSNPLRSTEPEDLGLENSFSWLDADEECLLMEDFWNDILSPAAVAEETSLYSTRSATLGSFALWPGPLTIVDFRALMVSGWIYENFLIRPVVIIPNANLFVQEMYHRKRENRSIIRLENLESLVRAKPNLTAVPFEELLQLEHTSEQFAAVYAILNNFFVELHRENPGIILFPYQALFDTPYQSIDFLVDELGMRKRRDVEEGLKAVRISYDGANYQKIPHSPKDPESWKAGLHPGQIHVINRILERMNCPAEGSAVWKAVGQEPVRSSRSGSRSRSGRSSGRSNSSSSDSRSGGETRRSSSSSSSLSSSTSTSRSSVNGIPSSSEHSYGYQEDGRSRSSESSRRSSSGSSGSSRRRSSSSRSRRSSGWDDAAKDLDY